MKKMNLQRIENCNVSIYQPPELILILPGLLGGAEFPG
jgi:hypothetical protein